MLLDTLPQGLSMAGENKAEKATSWGITLAAITGLVVLNIFNPEAPTVVNYGLVGAALGAKIEDIREWLGRK